MKTQTIYDTIELADDIRSAGSFFYRQKTAKEVIAVHYVQAKRILSAKNGMNIFRGCTHGCIYCDSRSRCYHMDHAFEDIEVKENALTLLELALQRKRRRCMIGTGSMSDPYMPLETELEYTRGALKLIDRYDYGITMITKSSRIERDMDLLVHINQKTKCVVQMTLTTYDEKLCKVLEPRVSTTKERFETLCRLRDRGIPTVVWLSPILPFINDTVENIEGLLSLCQEAGVYGVICFGMGMTLREGNREYFYQKLDESFPGLKEQYRQCYGNDYIISSKEDRELMNLFHERCEESGMVHDNDVIFRYLQTFEDKASGEQISLWGSERENR